MSVKQDIRDLLPDGATVFDNFAFDNSIIGISLDDRVIYSYEGMVEELMGETGWEVETAMDWIEHNVVGLLSYTDNDSPLIVSYCIGSY